MKKVCALIGLILLLFLFNGCIESQDDEGNDANAFVEDLEGQESETPNGEHEIEIISTGEGKYPEYPKTAEDVQNPTDFNVAIIEFALEDTQFTDPYHPEYDFLEIVNSKNEVTLISDYSPVSSNNVHSYYYFDDWYEEEAAKQGVNLSIDLEVLGPFILDEQPPLVERHAGFGFLLRIFFEEQAQKFVDIDAYDYVLYVYFDDRGFNPDHNGGFVSCAHESNKSAYIDQPIAIASIYTEQHLNVVLHEFAHLLGGSDKYAAIEGQYQCEPEGRSGIIGKACLLCGSTKENEESLYMLLVNDIEDTILCPKTLEEFGWK